MSRLPGEGGCACLTSPPASLAVHPNNVSASQAATDPLRTTSIPRSPTAMESYFIATRIGVNDRPASWALVWLPCAHLGHHLLSNTQHHIPPLLNDFFQFAMPSERHEPPAFATSSPWAYSPVIAPGRSWRRGSRSPLGQTPSSATTDGSGTRHRSPASAYAGPTLRHRLWLSFYVCGHCDGTRRHGRLQNGRRLHPVPPAIQTRAVIDTAWRPPHQSYPLRRAGRLNLYFRQHPPPSPIPP